MKEDSNLTYGKQHHQVVFIFTNTYSNVREQTLSERRREREREREKVFLLKETRKKMRNGGHRAEKSSKKKRREREKFSFV